MMLIAAIVAAFTVTFGEVGAVELIEDVRIFMVFTGQKRIQGQGEGVVHKMLQYFGIGLQNKIDFQV